MDLCRICLRKSASLTPLFKERNSIGDRINDIFNFDFQIRSLDSYPQKICTDCVTDFYRASQFYENARSAEHQLSLWCDDVLKEELQAESKDLYVIESDEPPESEDELMEIIPVTLENNDQMDESHEEYLIQEDEEQKPLVGKTNDTPKTSSKDLFTCDECGKIYDKKSSFVYHKKTKHTNPQNYEFPCHVCLKRFAYKYDLIRHERIHSNEKPFKCNECGKQFSDRSTHLKHERIHTGVKPFQCDKCPLSFSFKFSLDTHTLIHTGEKNFPCPECGKRFSRKAKMKDHFSRLHKRPFTTEDETRLKRMMTKKRDKLVDEDEIEVTEVDDDLLTEIVESI